MTITIFLRFLLGHLVGDFVLQPLWLALAKRKGWYGLILHVAIVTFVTAIMVWRVIPYWWFWVIVLFFVHLFIDQFRTFVFTDNSRGKGVVFFVLDQIVHTISLVIISWLVAGRAPYSMEAIFSGAISEINVILVLLCLVVASIWVVPILEIELVVAIISYRKPNPDQTKTQNIEPITISDRGMGGLERLLGLVLVASSLGIVMPLVFLPRFAWLLHKSTPGNRVVAVLKTGVSFVATFLMGMLVLQVDILSFFQSLAL